MKNKKASVRNRFIKSPPQGEHALRRACPRGGGGHCFAFKHFARFTNQGFRTDAVGCKLTAGNLPCQFPFLQKREANCAEMPLLRHGLQGQNAGKATGLTAQKDPSLERAGCPAKGQAREHFLKTLARTCPAFFCKKEKNSHNSNKKFLAIPCRAW